MVSGKFSLLSELLKCPSANSQECMVIKQATGVQASVKVLGVKKGAQKGDIYVYRIL